MKPIFFRSPEEFRAWLETHHETEKELLVGYHKVATGKPSLTWPQSVDEALCFGWIDGIRRSIGDDGYTIRFTPRKPTSNWSAINIARVAALTAEGRMRPAGLAAFAKRRENRSAIYLYENKPRTLDAATRKIFQSDRKAWDFFNAQPPGYRNLMVGWLMNAKRPETREKRLRTVMQKSRKGERVDLMKPYA